MSLFRRAVVAFLLCFAAIAQAEPARDYFDRAERRQLKPRQRLEKLARAEINDTHESSVIRVKFRDGFAAQVENGALKNLCAGPDGFSADQELMTAGTWRRSPDLPVEKLVEMWRRAEESSGEEFPDPTTYFIVRLPKGANAAEWIDRLNAHECVERARPMSRFGQTADTAEMRKAINDAVARVSANAIDPVERRCPDDPWYQNGADICSAWYDHGVTGLGSRVAILAQGPPIHNNDMPDYDVVNGGQFQGTAEDDLFMLMAGARNNNVGTTGMTYNSRFFSAAAYYCNSTNNECTFDPQGGVTMAATVLGPGGIMIIPYPVLYRPPLNASDHDKIYELPAEWDPDVYDAIRLAIHNGVIVLEAAGNTQTRFEDVIPNYVWRCGLYCSSLHTPGFDSQALIISGGTRGNTGRRVNYYIDVTGGRSKESTMLAGSIASLVQSSVVTLNVARNGEVPDLRFASRLTMADFRAQAANQTFKIDLTHAPTAIRAAQSRFNINASLRMQSPLPDATPMRLYAGNNEPQVLFFGPIARGNTLVVRLHLYNDGHSTLNLGVPLLRSIPLAPGLEPAPDGTFTFDEPPPPLIPPYGHVELQVLVKYGSAGSVRGELSFLTNDPYVSNPRIQFTAQFTDGSAPHLEVRNLQNAAVRPNDVVDFGTVYSRDGLDEASIRLYLTNIGKQDLVVQNVRISRTSGFEVFWSLDDPPTFPIVLKEGQVREITILMKNHLELTTLDKDVDATLNIYSNDQFDLTSYPIHLQGRVDDHPNTFVIKDRYGISYTVPRADIDWGPMPANEIFDSVGQLGLTWTSRQRTVVNAIRELIVDGDKDSFIEAFLEDSVIDEHPTNIILHLKERFRNNAGNYASLFEFETDDPLNPRFHLFLRGRPYKAGPNNMVIALATGNNTGVNKTVDAQSFPTVPVPIGSLHPIGTTTPNTPLSRAVTITNNGTAALYLSRLDSTNAAVQATLSSPSVAPGQTTTILVTLLSATPGNYRSGISFYADTNPPSLDDTFFTFDVQGEVERPPAPPSSTDFAVYEGDSRPFSSGYRLRDTSVAYWNGRGGRWFHFRNETEHVVRSLDNFRLTRDADNGNAAHKFSIEMMPRYSAQTGIAPGERVSFFIVYAPPHTALREPFDRSWALLQFDVNSEGCATLGPDGCKKKFRLQGENYDDHAGFGDPDYWLHVFSSRGRVFEYAPYDLGVNPNGWKTLRAENATGGAITLFAPEFDTNDGFEVRGLPASGTRIAAGASHSFEVRLTATAYGAHRAIFNIPIEGEVGGYGSHGVVVQAFVESGPRAAVKVGRAGLGYGATSAGLRAAPGKAVSRLFTIVNEGNQPLDITVPQVTGEGFSILKPETILTTLRANGGSTTFRVRMLATVARTYEAVVTFGTSDRRGSFFFRVKGVVGNGTAAALRVAQGATDIDNGGKYDPAAGRFTITNNSGETVSLWNLVTPAGSTVVQTLPASLAPGASGSLEVSGAGDDDPFPVIAFDTSLVDEDHFEMSPNRKPVALDDSIGTAIGTAVVINVTANDSDSDSDPVVLISSPIVTAPAFGTAVRVSDSEIRYTPNAGYNGSDTFEYEAGDGNGSRARARVHVNIGDNRAPEADDDVAKTPVDTPIDIDVTANDVDADGDRVTLISSPVVTAPLHGTATKVSGSIIRYVPAAGYSGTDTFQYEAGDGRGGRTTAWVNLVVGSDSNGRPVAVDDLRSGHGAPMEINVTANDTDPDGDSVTLISAPVVVAPQYGTAVKQSGSTILYTPNPEFSGNDAFQYEVGDGHGHRARAWVRISIGNQQPLARNESVTTPAGKAVTVNVTANDSDPDGDSITLISQPIVTAPLHGTAVKVSGSSITYTPAAGFIGNDSFQYEAGDGHGRRARGWVAITVHESNRKPVAADDSVSTTKEQAVVVSVTANDTDPDGHLVALISRPVITAPAHGTAVKIDGGKISYTPVAGYIGSDRFEYEIGDGHGMRARAWVNVTVTDPNRSPVAVNDSAATAYRTAVAIDVVANDSDPDGDPVRLITAPVVVAPQHGSAVKVSGSVISYTPAEGFAGSDSFTYEIGDGRGKRARATVSITVADANRPPLAEADDATTTTGVAVTVNVTANDSDPDGDTVRLITSPIIVAPQHGTATKISGSSITYTPAAGYNGTDSFTYEIGDGRGARSRSTVTITIAAVQQPPNRNPVAVNDAASTRPATPVSINVTANDSDPDGDTPALISAPVISAPAHGTAVKLNGSTITYTPAAGYVGSDTFQYEIGDGRGKRARAWVTLTVTDANSRPHAVDDTAATGFESAVTIDVTANDTDPDGDSPVLISNPIIVAPAHGTAAKLSGSAIRYTPAAGFSGSDRFQYEIGDGRGGRSRGWVNVSVLQIVALPYATNTDPVAANDVAVTKVGVEVEIDVVANDSDEDGQPLRLIDDPIVTAPEAGSARRGSDRTIIYTPLEKWDGNVGIQYEITDDAGGTSRGWVTIQIPSENRPPVATNDGASTSFETPVVLLPLGNDSDPDADAITLTAQAISVAPLHGFARRLSDTELWYEPAAGFTGVDSVEYEITDGKGTVARATISITVTGSNVPPVAVDDSLSVIAGSFVTHDVLTNDSDPNGDALGVIESSLPLHGSVTWLSEGSGVMTYTPDLGYTGADSFTYRISDGRGGQTTATVRVTVNPLRRAPVAVNDAASTPTLEPVLIGVLANDSDADGDRLSIVSVTTPSAGTVVRNGDESVTYTPANGFSGSATFTYTVRDPGGLQATATVTVTVTNTAPVAVGESFSAVEDVATSYYGSTLLANDTDADGHTLKIVSFTQPKNGGTVQASADFSGFSYKSKLNYYGLDSFTYTVSDGFGGTATATVTLQVGAVNDAPVANPDAFSVFKNQELVITQAQVLGNDTDVENHSIGLYAVHPPANGTAAIQSNGTILYKPYGEFIGTDRFEYVVTDGFNAYGTGTITVTVKRDDPPVARFTASCAGRTCTFDASTSTDDRGIVSYQWTFGNNSAGGGKIVSNYQYAAGGVYQVRLTIEDALGQRSVAAQWISLTEPPPDAVNDSFSFTKGYSRYIPYSEMLRNDTDPNNDTLTVTSTDATLTDGTLTCDATGCVFAPPSSYWWGQTTFKYTISDGHGGTDTATVTIQFR